MYMLKTNELAKEFIERGGFVLYSRLLDKECIEDYQIAYNVICALWIVSYHEYALRGFEDYNVYLFF